MSRYIEGKGFSFRLPPCGNRDHEGWPDATWILTYRRTTHSFSISYKRENMPLKEVYIFSSSSLTFIVSLYLIDKLLLENFTKIIKIFILSDHLSLNHQDLNLYRPPWSDIYFWMHLSHQQVPVQQLSHCCPPKFARCISYIGLGLSGQPHVTLGLTFDMLVLVWTLGLSSHLTARYMILLL